MFKSIFARLLTTYLLITVLVIASMTLILAALYKDAVFKEKKQTLDQIAQKANSLTGELYAQKISEQELNAEVNGMAYSATAVIYILKIDQAQFDRQQGLALNGLDQGFVAEKIRLVLAGRQVFEEKQYAEDLGSYVIFAGYPLTINGAIEGAVLLLCPVSNINQTVARMNLIILAVAVAMIMVSLPFIYFNSRRISKPIKEMDLLAQRITQGQESVSARVLSNDEIGRLARSFNEMKDRIAKNEKMRNDLIADISHELRTPLTSINGFVKGILDGVVEPDNYQEYMVLVREETKRLISLTSNLLDLAKIQSGSVPLQKERLALSVVVDAVLSVLHGSAANKQLTVRNNVAADLYVLADSSALKQVLINIVSNAVKYTPTGGLITIEAGPNGGEICLTVRDNGVGIAAEDMPYIFEKFYRSDKVRTAGDKSTGLGLAIAKNLVELNGGRIWAESRPGQGTSLMILLPGAK